MINLERYSQFNIQLDNIVHLQIHITLHSHSIALQKYLFRQPTQLVNFVNRAENITILEISIALRNLRLEISSEELLAVSFL